MSLAIRALVFMILGLTLSACSVIAIRKHEPGFKNVRSLEQLKGSYSVGAVSAPADIVQKKLATNSLSCRLTTFETPSGMNLGDYVKTALNDELDAAKKLNTQGKAIAISVNKIESDSSSMDKGIWTLDFNYKVGSKSMNVNTVTKFESAFAADTACRNTANALTDALSENFQKFYEQLAR